MLFDVVLHDGTSKKLRIKILTVDPRTFAQDLRKAGYSHNKSSSGIPADGVFAKFVALFNMSIDFHHVSFHMKEGNIHVSGYQAGSYKVPPSVCIL